MTQRTHRVVICSPTVTMTRRAYHVLTPNKYNTFFKLWSHLSQMSPTLFVQTLASRFFQMLWICDFPAERTRANVESSRPRRPSLSCAPSMRCHCLTRPLACALCSNPCCRRTPHTPNLDRSRWGLAHSALQVSYRGMLLV